MISGYRVLGGGSEKPSLTSYKELRVWQLSRELVTEVYALTSSMPREETYGLISQMRRAAISIPSNIAEGYRRNNRKEYLQFLGTSTGSAAELETQLILASDLFKLENKELLEQINTIQKMLLSLVKKLKPAH